MTTIRAGWILTQRELAHWVREPWAPIFGVLFSIMLLLVFGFLFGGAITLPGGGEYIDYLLPGMMALSMMFGVESTATAMANDAKKGITDRFRSMPIGSASVALGRVGADMTNSAFELLVLIVGGLLVGWRITSDPASAALAVLLLLLLRFAVLWIGIFLGLSFRGGGATAAVQVLVWPIGFLSTAIVSAETMPAWLGAIAAWNPLSATATAVRQLFGNPTGVTAGILQDGAVWLALAWPLVLTAVFVPLSARAYRRLRA
ncbi:ABC-type multidrug transport system permease subunit [Actinoplanes lutulentus]|uniref:Transport permease protein n=1 Tax=Actinoplanes lutulentus TaxID=1287878 RepID=A0A327YYJ3_9ACTN|nr:ABC transporter permease [Actinoplanes lutulentus]MBB2940390.1 ABC-type multidrug transport system permease subunit [Actinoplanes lutulentus]RAK25877.1 ABC-type polysaccharide/polyol phosphate export permease [Actinoplanes lutulentus]